MPDIRANVSPTSIAAVRRKINMHINFLLLSFVFNLAYKDKKFKKDKNNEAIWKGLFENRFGREKQ